MWGALVERVGALRAAQARLAELAEPRGLGWPVPVGRGFGWPGVARDPQPEVGPVWTWASPAVAAHRVGASQGPEVWLAQARRRGLPRPETGPPSWVLAVGSVTSALPNTSGSGGVAP